MKKRYIIILIILLISSYGIYYITDYYHADNEVKNYINGTDNISVIKSSSGLFINSSGNDTALIFYPGAKIEYTSYLPLLTQIANSNIDCFLVEMPFNLAFLSKDSANDIIEKYNYTKYFIAGHSLGGVMASQYVHDTNKTNGLILLASYPTDEIKKPVLSIYGSEDKILNKQKYDESKTFMKNLTEIIINGGNHAQIGNYGNQSGDGIAKITSKQQQKQSAKEIIYFIKNSN